MSLYALMVHDVTLVRAGPLVDRYGDTVKDWGTVTRVDVRGWVSQSARSEDLDSREARVAGWVCFLPADADVSGLDRVEWGGLTFEVDGPPNPAWSPQLRGVHHLELNLRLVEG